MTPAPGKRPAAGLASGTAEVRLMGPLPVINALAVALTGHPAVELVTSSAPCRNRREAGERLYLTVRVDTTAQVRGQCTATKQSTGPASPKGGTSIMTPHRLAGELARTLQGPHSGESTEGAAWLAAEAVRYLNYATGPHASAGLTEPATVYTVAGSLSAAAYRLPQLCRQLADWLAREHTAGHLAADSGSRSAHAATWEARGELENAQRLAAELGDSLGMVQSLLSGVRAAGGGEGR